MQSRGQRAASDHVAVPLAAPPTNAEPVAANEGLTKPSPRSAVRRARHVPHRQDIDRMECADVRAMAGDVAQRRLAGRLRQAGLHVGEGGSISFMGMLGDRFPEAQFVVTGVLGPGSECSRSQRVPPPPDRQEADRRAGNAAEGSRDAKRPIRRRCLEAQRRGRFAQLAPFDSAGLQALSQWSGSPSARPPGSERWPDVLPHERDRAGRGKVCVCAAAAAV